MQTKGEWENWDKNWLFICFCIDPFYMQIPIYWRLSAIFRLSTSMKKDLQREKSYREPDAKRIKAVGQAPGEKVNLVGEKMIELDFVSSDEEV